MLSHLAIGNIKLVYHSSLDGGGSFIHPYFSSYFKRWYFGKVFNRCLEWCSGPGFIGLELLDKGICDQLDLVDFYLPNQKVFNLTKQLNSHIESSIYFHLSNNLDGLPKSIKFDLVVGNPPMFNTDPYQARQNDPRKYKDSEWNLHKDFFLKIGDFLSDGSRILLIEHVWGSSLSTFSSMIQNGGLEVVNHEPVPENKLLWFLELKK